MNSRYPSEDESYSEDGSHYWISISDLMTSLLFIFILILAYVIFTFHNKSMAYEQNRDARQELLRDINQTLYEQGITEISIDYTHGTMRVGSGVLFRQNEFILKDENAEKTIAAIGNAIKHHFLKEAKYKKAINTIFVEGHSDSDNFSTLYTSRNGRSLVMTNKELSTFRAIEVYNVMDKYSNLDNDLKIKNSEGNKLFSYSGYSDTRPIDETKINGRFTSNAKDNNRRVEFFFALSAPKYD